MHNIKGVIYKMSFNILSLGEAIFLSLLLKPRFIRFKTCCALYPLNFQRSSRSDSVFDRCSDPALAFHTFKGRNILVFRPGPKEAQYTQYHNTFFSTVDSISHTTDTIFNTVDVLTQLCCFSRKRNCSSQRDLLAVTIPHAKSD